MGSGRETKGRRGGGRTEPGAGEGGRGCALGYVVQAFETTRRGRLSPLSPVPADSEGAARRLVARLGARHGGAVALAQRFDGRLQRFDDVEVLCVVGRVPAELGEAGRPPGA